MKKYNVAVVGASGNVGREILNILDFRSFPIKEMYALASSKSEGQKIVYGNFFHPNFFRSIEYMRMTIWRS